MLPTEHKMKMAGMVTIRLYQSTGCNAHNGHHDGKV